MLGELARIINFQNSIDVIRDYMNESNNREIVRCNPFISYDRFAEFLISLQKLEDSIAEVYDAIK